jgi:hypothetical protein
MPRLERPSCSIEELHETQLDNFEAMLRAGVAMTTPAAADYCAQHGLIAPAWLTKASAELFCQILKLDTRKTMGRSNGLITRLRQDMIDYARWDEVDLVLEQRKRCRREIAELRTLPKTPRELPQKREMLLKQKEKMLKWLGDSLNRAYECASERLEKTGAFGGPDAMEASYYKIKKKFKDPVQAKRYHQLDPRFLRKMGLKALLPAPSVRKSCTCLS